MDEETQVSELGELERKVAELQSLIVIIRTILLQGGQDDASVRRQAIGVIERAGGWWNQ